MRKICTVDGCKALVLGGGLCSKHYHRQRRTGTTDLLDRRTYCECGAPAVAFGLCDKHYRQQRAPLVKEARRRSKEGRTCAWCGAPIPVERRANALYCGPECKKHSMNERQRQRPEYAARLRVYHYARKFGITVADYDRMLAEQAGRCAICGTSEPGGRGIYHVDHCHETEVVRGLLCSSCNTGLGHFRDSPQRLRAAISYLEAHPCPPP